LDGKIAQIAQTDPVASEISDRLERFKAVNEYMRTSNEALIHKYSTAVTEVDLIVGRDLNPFYAFNKNAKELLILGHRKTLTISQR